MSTIKDSLERSHADRFSGRERELARLATLFDPTGPLIVLLHGVGGIGKTSLVRVFERESAARGRQVRVLDCRGVEPVPLGLLSAIGASLGVGLKSVSEAAAAVGALAEPVVFALDNYESLRLLDGWLRTEFLPALPVSARFIIMGRSLATAPWIASPGWADHVLSLRLGPLPEADVVAFLARRGFTEAVQDRIARFSRGNPLALQLCTASLADKPDALSGDLELNQVIEYLAFTCVNEIADPALRDAIEAASLVRRVTRPVLEAMLPEHSAEGILANLRQLSFVEPAADGLVFHEAFRLAIESRVAAVDPARTRKLKRAAWQSMRDQLSVAGGRDTWRHTADLLFLLERPVLREAFFPSGATLPVERANPADRDAILDIARIHDGDSGAALLAEWWKDVAQLFSVVRGRVGEVAGFYVLARPQDIPQSLAECDPLLAVWLSYAHAQGGDPRRPYLLIRCLLSRVLGERQSPEWAACVLDAKRAYLENPRAVGVLTAIREPASIPQAVMDLGFELEPSLTVPIGQSLIHTAVLPFGPQGPMHWMLEFVGSDLSREPVGSSKPQVELDVSRRQLATRDGGRFPLTKLEFELMSYLSQRPGTVVTRDELLREVWKQPFGGSNVVDVVVRSLRRKLGGHAWIIGTVKGHGYQYNEPES
ncbi:winged helix-turn-helix domain-containing protein [uncultured Paludibaculum sp.]|uniref:winged helix-turn-helix domain-containing protein n=1 Tax=uncultured Paludibaculum sp. TaxID=1765020 RepID=UPI002AABA276|nr:winged helix-turn-helix domain-containing protein [uncultured Paludibaculum sp.]